MMAIKIKILLTLFLSGCAVSNMDNNYIEFQVRSGDNSLIKRNFSKSQKQKRDLEKLNGYFSRKHIINFNK